MTLIKTKTKAGLMSVIPSDNLNAHILGEGQPPTHLFSFCYRTRFLNVEGNVAAVLWR